MTPLSVTTPRVAVCSWSLRPGSARDLAERAGRRGAGVRWVQLALDPIREGRAGWGEAETRRALGEVGIGVVSGMMAMADEDYSTLESIRRTGGVRPDATWARNLSAARQNAALARRLGIGLVTFHAGFLPHEQGDAERKVLMDRLRELGEVFASCGVRVGLETGQETAETLFGVLRELGMDEVGVNFDPANMILYGAGDPVAALRRLAPHVRQVHIKDALPSRAAWGSPPLWGEEVVAGAGAVVWESFFRAYREVRLDCDLVIEREAGERRVEDVATAQALVESHFRASPGGGAEGGR